MGGEEIWEGKEFGEGIGGRGWEGREGIWEEESSKIGHGSRFSNRMPLPTYEWKQYRGFFGSIMHPHKGQLDEYHRQISQTFAVSLETSNTYLAQG